nr:methyl-CpG-binding domain-containing protein 4-like [Tanacetum cinerariifolium]
AIWRTLLKKTSFLLTRLTLFSIDSQSTPIVSAVKLPILKPNEFDLWKMRIEQYFLMTDYSLWEVILNGDSPVPIIVVDGVVQPVSQSTTRKRKGVVIRDLEEKSTAIIPAETKSKDKGKGIIVEEPKPIKKKDQVELDEEYARKLHKELNKDIDWDMAIEHIKQKAKEDSPADIEYDSSRTWVMDKPNIPKTPKGFQRIVVLKRDYSKMDVYYETPDGTRVRAAPGIIADLKEHPEYSDISPTDFCFTSPK